MKKKRVATLKDIARIMKYEAYNNGKSERQLTRGLNLTLEPYNGGWKLTMQRDNTEPSKKEYKIISKAFFNTRIRHLSQPDKNTLELITSNQK